MDRSNNSTVHVKKINTGRDNLISHLVHFPFLDIINSLSFLEDKSQCKRNFLRGIKNRYERSLRTISLLFLLVWVIKLELIEILWVKGKKKKLEKLIIVAWPLRAPLWNYFLPGFTTEIRHFFSVGAALILAAPSHHSHQLNSHILSPRKYPSLSLSPLIPAYFFVLM
ncbi:uncharacterized protein NDAI_0A03610 [Naumovozyma dairenensis CBS 421]|uniref:Uncharacterized protein n=1 Tax=Naumovozyma dairenensis (strain ATCC 10597 / BCRC 20456 / CBS 421 / NBRC 0211 / NRRL Y-12639) TaxID=1071378 RepID=G0W3Y0_NAUDC|nr:hypothetical protein NDAI_0A03610 [Naumovozyma dairenensis CBS 421]CCD22518.1 hypothetical protein NDAI_0A03610 [Naumovozyma dairenensis CBS 421]